MENDCQSLVKKLQSEEVEFSVLGNLTLMFKEQCDVNGFEGLNHVSRLCNSTAHDLASWGLNISDDQPWFEVIPPCITSVVQVNMS